MTLEEMKAVSRAKASPTMDKAKQAKLEGETLTLKAAYRHEVTLLNEKTGELESHTRVLLDIGQDAMLSFVSTQAAAFVDMLAEYEPSLAFDPPLAIQFTMVNTRSGRRTYSFAVV